MSSVALRDVWKTFPGDVHALKGLSLEAQDGECLVLVGPSGCGKSTALRTIAGLEKPTRGTVSIGSTVVNDVPPDVRDIAMIFQNYALYPHMTVYKNMAFGLKMARVPRREIRERVDAAATLLGLTDLLGRKPRQLSGGQRQRVAMGRAIVRRPQVFLMDEPLSNLDAQLRTQVRVDIARLQKSLAVTTVYVTHDQVEAMTIGDRVAVLRAGEVEQVGTPDELFERPATLFVATFIGSPAMNAMRGRVAGADGALTLEVGGDTLPLDDAALRRYPRLRERVGGEIVVGMRPDDLALSSPNGSTAGYLRGRVALVESLGGASLLYVDRPGQGAPDDLLVARVAGAHHFAIGDAVAVRPPTAGMHFFDLESEKALA